MEDVLTLIGACFTMLRNRGPGSDFRARMNGQERSKGAIYVTPFDGLHKPDQPCLFLQTSNDVHDACRSL